LRNYGECRNGIQYSNGEIGVGSGGWARIGARSRKRADVGLENKIEIDLKKRKIPFEVWQRPDARTSRAKCPSHIWDDAFC
jgi:hypothetical protein